ncbi:MAG: SusC/RagA family TonB-linked outer membrane protein [Bacteroidales bacterium]|jgi:TonB-linked SusC/RagA family outer membrane protein|nr:SusC/RagA family TonB-linked outer membrane protein [Bacteroidales bacterium]
MNKKVRKWAFAAMLVLFCVCGYSQTIPINGTITDQAGEAMPGVNIRVKGTSTGAVTDIAGKYTISVPSGESVLVFSFIGFKSVEMTVGDRREISVKLDEETRELDEVVVVGYGTMKKRDLTGSVSQMKSSVVANEAPRDVRDMLRANVAGLNISYSTGAKPGGDLQVRGKNTLKAGSSPLLVLDGVIYYGGLEDINPSDIETIDVLKDASSAAVYGAKAASGVVVIMTRKGRQGKPQVNASASIGFVTMGAQMPVYDGAGYIKWRGDLAKSIQVTKAAQNPGMFDDPYNLPAGVTQEQWLSYDANDGDLLKTYFTRLYMQDNELENYKNNKETNWYDAVFKPGLQQDYNVSLSGKKDEISYYWSLGYADNESLIYGEDFSTIRSRANMDADVTKFLTVGMSTQFAYRDESRLYWDSDPYKQQVRADWGAMLAASPWGDMYNADGTYRRRPMGDEVSSNNPFYEMSHNDRDRTYTTLNSSLYAKIKLPLDITFQTTYVPRIQFLNFMNHQKSTHMDWAAKGGMVRRMEEKVFQWQLDNLLKWNKTFGIHSFDVTLLQNAEKRQLWRTTAYNELFSPNDVLGYHNIKGGTNPSVDSADEYSTGSAYMARVFYSLMDRYMITGTFRRDGYSAFGQTHPWANFGSVALAWRFTGENFWSGSLKDILEHGKLRVSYGTNGNRDIGMYQAISDLNTSGKYWYADATTGAVFQRSQMYVNRMSNKNLKWESTAAFNFGLDFTFNRQIVDGSIDIYRGNTTNLLVDRKLPDILGFSNVADNLGEVQNSGVELTLNTNNIRREKLSWRTTFSFSTNKNKIVKLYGDMVDILDDQGNVIGEREGDDYTNKWFIGRPINQIWELQPLGVWQSDEEEEAKKYGVAPGDFKIYDPDGNIKFENSDKQFLGQKDPKFRWTLRNEFTILRDFNLSFMLYSYWGHKKEYNRPKNNDGFKDRSTDYVLPYWTVDNPINTHARLQSSNGSASYSIYWDNSFIRLDNISLAYTVPAQISQKAAIQNLKLFFTIRNVAVWTKKWEFWDPENSGPTPRYFTFGLNMTL